MKRKGERVLMDAAKSLSDCVGWTWKRYRGGSEQVGSAAEEGTSSTSNVAQAATRWS